MIRYSKPVKMFCVCVVLSWDPQSLPRQKAESFGKRFWRKQKARDGKEMTSHGKCQAFLSVGSSSSFPACPSPLQLSVTGLLSRVPAQPTSVSYNHGNFWPCSVPSAASRATALRTDGRASLRGLLSHLCLMWVFLTKGALNVADF